MSLLKNILRPFVEFPDDAKPAPAQGKEPQPVAPKPVAEQKPAAPGQTAPAPELSTFSIPVSPPSSTAAASAAPVTALPEHHRYFENLMEESNAKNPFFQGTDFKEFIESKSDIDAISDEATRYRTAFSVLKRTGLTKERLLSTGQEYLNIIGRALNSYQTAFVQQYQKEVKGKEVLLQKKAEEVQALNEKIAVLKADMKQISGEIAASKQALDANKASFLTAGEIKQTEIQQELQKIEQYF